MKRLTLIELEARFRASRLARRGPDKPQGIKKPRRRLPGIKKPRDPDAIPESCPISIKEPAGFYVYAYIDPRNHEVFYIGKGHRNRLTRHLTRKSLQKRDTFFYRKLKKMLRNGVLPEIIVIKDDLTSKEASLSEIDLIHLVGTRHLGTGPLCNIRVDIRGGPTGYTLEQGIKLGTAIECWGEMFPSLTHVSHDPCCEVSIHTLWRLLKTGESLQEAVKKSNPRRNPMNSKPITCWGEEFISKRELANDPRCIVTYSTLVKRLRGGLPPAEAAGIKKLLTYRLGKPITCWNQEFPSIVALARDPRCVVQVGCLRERLSSRWSPERAATQPLDSIAARQ